MKTDRETFLRRAMETHGDTVYRLALCRLQNVQDAEDVYQDVFLRLLQAAPLDWEAERMKAWLIRTALNRCADVGRFRLRRPTLPLEAVPELAAEADDRASALWEAVGRLPKEQRIAVHLFYAEGYATEEIAALMDCAPATVRTRLRRARLKLKDLLEGAEYDEKPLSGIDGDDPCPCRTP